MCYLAKLVSGVSKGALSIVKRSARYLLQETWFESWPGILGTSFTELQQWGKRRISLYSSRVRHSFTVPKRNKEIDVKTVSLGSEKGDFLLVSHQRETEKFRGERKVQWSEKSNAKQKINWFSPLKRKKLFLSFRMKIVKLNDVKNTYLEAKQKMWCEIKLFFVVWSEKRGFFCFTLK